MKTNRRIADPVMGQESRQPAHNSMEAFEAMMYIPVSLAQLELALTGRNISSRTDIHGSAEQNNRDKNFSQVA